MAAQWTAGNTSGSVLTAAKLNTIGAAWETYTPQPIQGGFATNFTTNYSRYALFQKTCLVQMKLTFTGSAGAIAGQNILINLPFNPVLNTAITGSYYYLDSGTANYGGALVGTNVGTAYCFMIASSLGVLGANPNFQIAVNDTLQFSCAYEVA
jgi:hypothetical protein